MTLDTLDAPATLERPGAGRLVGGNDVDYTADELGRFMCKYEVDPDTGCWVWQHGRDPDGYAIFRAGGKSVRAHRWFFQFVYGPISAALHLDHFECDNPSCVNPLHLRPVTPRENLLRGNAVQAWNLAKTHCKRGHEFTVENTARRKNGQRICRACQAWHQRNHRARKASV